MATYTTTSVRSALGLLSAERRHHPDADHSHLESALLEQRAGYALSQLQTRQPGVHLDGDALDRVMAVLR